MQIRKLGGLPKLVGLCVGSVLCVRVVQRRRPLILKPVTVYHLIVDNFSDDVPEGCCTQNDPIPEMSFLPEMLRVEGFRLEI